MATLKTDYQDEVLASGYEHRVYNIKKHSGGTSVESGVYLERVDSPQKTGTPFQAKDINDTNKQVNQNTNDIDSLKESMNDRYTKNETDKKLEAKQNTINYGSELPGSGIEGQMFILI